MIEIVNRQRKVMVETEIFLEFAKKTERLIFENEPRDFTLAFVSDRKMKELNSSFRGKNATTDVLSFPFEPDAFELSPGEHQYLGDIAISVERAKKQAAENNLSLEKELKQLILHGILHLSGYDHETDGGEMNRLELLYRDRLLIS